MEFLGVPQKCASHYFKGRAFRYIPAHAGDAAAIPNAASRHQSNFGFAKSSTVSFGPCLFNVQKIL